MSSPTPTPAAPALPIERAGRSMSSPPPAVPALPMGRVHLALRNLIQEDLFSETCRKNSFCLTCNQAFCSHCCFYHHVHSLGVNMVVKIGLDAGGLPVIPTRTDEGHRIMRCMVEEMAAGDYTSRLPRDAFCLYCGKALCAAACSHHDHRREGLPDTVVRIEERGGRRCVRCTGTEWWTSHMDVALGDPVHRPLEPRRRCPRPHASAPGLAPPPAEAQPPIGAPPHRI